MKFNCDDVTERLPWLLNGTLGDEEHEAVREHLTQCASCRRALKDTRLAWETFDQHPPTEEIVALAWGETSNAALEEHLKSCPRCTAELELARMSRRLEEDEKIVPMPARRTQTEIAPAATRGWRGWRNAAVAASLAGVVGLSGWLHSANRVQNLEEQIAARPAPPVATVPAPSPASPTGAGEPSTPSPQETEQARRLAAELEERTREMETLRGQLQELNGRLDQIAEARPVTPRPQVNAWVRDVRPTGDVIRGGGAEGALEVPARESAVLFLGTAHRETHGDHAIEIADAAGEVVWSQGGVVRDSAGADNYTLALPPGTLRPGDYTIRVYGLNGGQREPAETYAIRVR
jgi:hypothetical protein